MPSYIILDDGVFLVILCVPLMEMKVLPVISFQCFMCKVNSTMVIHSGVLDESITYWGEGEINACRHAYLASLSK